jgi:hypothetical protein
MTPPITRLGIIRATSSSRFIRLIIRGGPWFYIGEKSALQFIADRKKSAYHWYGPTFSLKFISNHPDGSMTVIMLFSGSTWEDQPDSLYKNNSCPVKFYTDPLPKLRETFNDTAARYSDGGLYLTNRN